MSLEILDQLEEKIKQAVETIQLLQLEVEELKEMVLEVIAEIDDRLSIHDFRSTKGPYLTNLIFDLVVPHQYKYTDKEVQDMVHNAIQKKNPKCFAVVTVERSYIK